MGRYDADVEMKNKKKNIYMLYEKKRMILPVLGAAVWGVGKTKETDGESIVET